MDSSEDRIRALQRVAFGVDATADQRAQALAELAALDSDPERQGSAETDAAAAAGATAAPAPPGSGSTGAESTGAGSTGADDAGRRRLIRWTVAAAAAGIALGGLLGWIVASVLAESEAPSAGPPAATADPGLPLEDTELLAMFDRLPPAAESARVAAVEDAIDPESVRLLATRVDGPTAFLARTAEGGDVCLVILLPNGTARSECTVEGRLPSDGLTISYGAYGYGLAAAQLDPTGSVSLGLVISY
ncbi:hypothetical protein ASE14_11685 [Agromyces sp. Root81]|uniref:hypothetical protein n=1 Tax=Agromyces sp. Root81 TaxID=1736601 RepID=UPI0006FE58DC|nr:hypothetical protein [Agromyces sp. Root81]KRC61511.1 hypothetical protein ASE14_11685 [Agromyces sp. Root81]